MTIREEVRKLVTGLVVYAAPTPPEMWSRLDARIDKGVDDLMSLAPLRLAELAEARPNSQVVVVDTVTNTWMRNPADVWNAGYRKVVAQ